MPSDMDMSGMAMGSTNEEKSQSQAHDHTFNAVSDHTMPNMEMLADGVVQTAELKFGSGNPLKDGSPCVHERCSKTSISASAPSPGANHSPPDCLQSISHIRNLLSPGDLIEVGTSPPDIPAILSLVTALRI